MRAANGATEKIAIPMHDSSNGDISRLLLKIGVELLAVLSRSAELDALGDFVSARDVVLGRDQEPWPYAVLTQGNVPSQMVSVFAETPGEHQYIRACGFDLFLHEIEEHKVLALQYGHFASTASISSRDLNWISILKSWNAPYVCCPVEFIESFFLPELPIRPMNQ
jgi:hypothetical protein